MLSGGKVLSTDAEIRVGLISSVEPQKKDPSRVSVFVDGEFAFGVEASLAAEHGFRKGVLVGPEDVKLALTQDAVQRAFNAAVHLLSFRMRTVQEIHRRLVQKGFDDAEAEVAVRRLTSRGYLNDRRLAKDYAQSRIHVRGEGLHRIRATLLRRGVGRDIVEEVLGDIQSEVAWLEIAREQAHRRWQRLGTTTDSRRRQKKLFDFLLRRGFDYDIARRVTAEFKDRSESEQ
jgi:regulatory protein